MASLLRFAALTLIVMASALPAPASAAPSASQIVQSFHDALTATMKDGEKLGFDGRYKKLEPTIQSTFNLPLMAKHAIGFYWGKAKADEQKQVVEKFSAFSTSNYASRFKKYDGEQFKITGEKEVPGGVIVESTIIPKGQKPVALNYILRTDDSGKLKVVDVYLDAAISELATRRAEFTSVIKREGLSAFIRHLDAMTDRMSATR